MMGKSGCMPIGSVQFTGMWKQFEAAVKSVVQSTADQEGTRQYAADGSRASTHWAHLGKRSKPPTCVNAT
jgi:hypothetical protein